MAVVYTWEWKLASPPSALWSLVSDTQRVNRAVGLAAWSFTEVPDPLGGAKRTGSFRFAGLLPIEWTEHPYEWIEGREMSIVRTYHKGPLHEVTSRVVLEPDGAGTKLRHTVEVKPRGLLGRLLTPIEIGWKTGRAFDKLYRELDRVAQQPGRLEFPEKPTSPARGAEAIIDAAKPSLVDAGVDPALFSVFRTHLLRAGDRFLMRIRPFELADQWEADRRQVLRMMLFCTRAGVLDMSWDLICPQCRGAKVSETRLDRVAKDVHCSSCNIRFDTDFARSVEITFRPHRAIRALEDRDYCVGGPGNTVHVVSQRRVPARTATELEADLAPGEYRIRGPRISGGRFTLQVGSVAPGGVIQVPLPARRESDQSVQATAGRRRIAFANPESFEQVAVLERTAWSTQVVTAALVGTLPEFRELFSSQVPAPGMIADSGRLAFLFSDLEGSTALYEKLGEARAFALVRDHFEFLAKHITSANGAVVKRIGDAVMAVFPTGEDAVRAAFRIQRDVPRFQKEKDAAMLRLKIGVHEGPCYAVNLDDRFDYFGTTVNVAARLQAAAQSDELVIDGDLAASAAVAQLLAIEPHTATPAEDATLKGLTRTFRVLRIRPTPGTAETGAIARSRSA